MSDTKEVPVNALEECKCADPRPIFSPVHKRDEQPPDTTDAPAPNMIVICRRCRGWLPTSYGDRSITVLDHYKRTLPALPDGSRVRRKIAGYNVAFIRRDGAWEYDGAR